MKIKVDFTVTVDLDEYNKRQAESGVEPVSAATLRRALQNTAADAIAYSLGDLGVDVDIIHNN